MGSFLVLRWIRLWSRFCMHARLDARMPARCAICLSTFADFGHIGSFHGIASRSSLEIQHVFGSIGYRIAFECTINNRA